MMNDHEKYVLGKLTTLFKDPGFICLLIEEEPITKQVNRMVLRPSYQFLMSEYRLIAPDLLTYIYKFLPNGAFDYLCQPHALSWYFMIDMFDILQVYYSPKIHEEEEIIINAYAMYQRQVCYICDKLGITVEAEPSHYTCAAYKLHINLDDAT